MTSTFSGKLLVITAPSGAGKTTIVKHLIKTYPELAFSVSATNRPARPEEKEGIDYYFISTEEFKQKISSDAFLEWEEVYDEQFYGTLRSEVERLWQLEKHIIFDIDVRGATNIKKVYGPSCLTVFIKPPSFQELVRRLRGRQTETSASFRKRITRIKKELSYETTFDKILVNDLLDVALKEAELITEEFIFERDEEE
ncbi:MAG: guanylate kinase [Saprospiraceae bacterium]|nr:guanylate kinase [Saprospiraceae bacterium]